MLYWAGDKVFSVRGKSCREKEAKLKEAKAALTAKQASAKRLERAFQALTMKQAIPKTTFCRGWKWLQCTWGILQGEGGQAEGGQGGADHEAGQRQTAGARIPGIL